MLVNHQQHLSDAERTRLSHSVAQAAPVVANLRTLAIAELRAATDALTGLPNNRAVQDTIKQMVAQAGRAASPLTAAMLDLDHFKSITDTYGHARGDDLLAAVGITIRDSIRESDFVGRYGGEEFIILLPATGPEGAAIVAETIRAAQPDRRLDNPAGPQQHRGAHE